jgi:hypothetical protein
MTLAQLLARIERGERLPTDSWLLVVPQPSSRAAAVVTFPGLGVVAADLDPAWVHTQLPGEDLSAPLNPPFLRALEDKLGRRVNNIDLVMLATPVAGDPEKRLAEASSFATAGLAGSPRIPARPHPTRASPEHALLALTELDDADHPRVRRARRYRDDVRIWAADGGILIMGRGLGGRWEAAIEVDEVRRNAGLGRQLAAAARHLVPEDRPVWAQIAPGNAASVRAFLAAGYVPVGAEALLVP